MEVERNATADRPAADSPAIVGRRLALP